MIKRMNRPAWFIVPYWSLFLVFIILPVIAAIFLSFTYFNAIETPRFVGINNYIELITTDTVFMQYVLSNTLRFALIVGPFGYIMAFLLAWMLAQISAIPRTILAIILYSPSLTLGVAMAAMWRIIFSGDANGYLNAILLSNNLILDLDKISRFFTISQISELVFSRKATHGSCFFSEFFFSAKALTCSNGPLPVLCFTP